MKILKNIIFGLVLLGSLSESRAQTDDPPKGCLKSGRVSYGIMYARNPETDFTKLVSGSCPSGWILADPGVILSEDETVPTEAVCVKNGEVSIGIVQTSEALAAYNSADCSETKGVVVLTSIQVETISPGPITYTPPSSIRSVKLADSECVRSGVVLSGILIEGDTQLKLTPANGESCPSDQFLVKKGVVLLEDDQVLSSNQCLNTGILALARVLAKGEVSSNSYFSDGSSCAGNVLYISKTVTVLYNETASQASPSPSNTYVPSPNPYEANSPNPYEANSAYPAKSYDNQPSYQAETYPKAYEGSAVDESNKQYNGFYPKQKYPNYNKYRDYPRPPNPRYQRYPPERRPHQRLAPLNRFKNDKFFNSMNKLPMKNNDIDSRIANKLGKIN